MKFIPVKNLPKYLALMLCLAFSSGYLHGQIDFEILSGDAQICAGDSTLLSIDAAVDSVQWSPTTGVSMPNSLATFVSPTQSTSYFATLFSDGQTTNVRFEVDVFSAPDLGNEITVCGSTSLDFDLNNVPFPIDYTLTSNTNFGIQQINPNIFRVITNTPSPGTFDLIANSPCGQPDTIQITVLAGTAALLPNFNFEDSVVCPGDPVNFTVVPQGVQMYEWFANGVSVSMNSIINDNPIVTTTYVLSVSDTMNCAVPTLDSVTVTVNAPPAISLPETILSCENDIVQLGNNIAQVGTTYSWAPNDNIIDPNVVNAEVLVLEDETYILTASNGCEIQDTVEVTLIDNDLDIEMDTLFLCKGDSITIPFTTSPPQDDVVWTTIDGVPLVNVGTPFIVAPQDVVTFIGTVENNGCTHSDTVTIQVDSLPVFPELELIELDMMAPICMGDTVLLQDDPVFPPNLYPDLTFQWFTGDTTAVPSIPGQLDGFLTPDSLLQILFLGTQTMQYNRLNINGACTSFSFIDVPVIPILEIDILPRDTVCPGTSFTLMPEVTDPSETPPRNVDPNDLEEWQWMTSSGTIEPAEGEPNPVFTAGADNANVMVSAEYMGCPTMGMNTIPVFTTPLLIFPTSTICPGDLVSLNLGAVEPGFTFIWSSTANDLNGQENDSNPQVSPLATTTYSVTVSNAGCAPVMDEVTINIFDSVGSFDSIEDTGCIGQNLTLSIPSGFDGGPNPVYTWVPQSGQSPTLQGSSVEITVIGDEVYVISVTNDCVTQNVGQAIISEMEYDGEFLDIDMPLCFIETGTQTIGLPDDFDGGSNPVFTWKELNGTVVNEGETFESTFTSNTTFTICVSNDCVTDFEIGDVNVTVINVAEFIITCDTNMVSEGQILSLGIDPITPNATYTWQTDSPNGGSFSADTGITNTYIGSTDGENDQQDNIMVTAELMGCTQTYSKNVIIETSNIMLPNIFTPGGPENNVFRIRGTLDNEFVTVTNLQIYDRWGNRVYDNDNAEQEWDGTIGGNPAPSEVYIYTVTYQIAGQDPITRSSDLTLLR